MPSLAQIAAFAGLASLAVASPIEKIHKRGSTFRLNQVETTSKVPKAGAIAVQKALQKYGAKVPTHVAAAAAAAVSGSVETDPEQYDSEYLTEVDVGGTTLKLDFDTGSSDLLVALFKPDHT